MIEKVIEEEEGKIAKVRAIGSKRLNCPWCGKARLHRHGSAMKRRVLHSWSSGKKVYLELCRQRWRCRECNHFPGCPREQDALPGEGYSGRWWLRI